MMTTFMMITPFILFAWGLQYCLNQLIAEDLDNFDQDRSQSIDEASLT